MIHFFGLFEAYSAQAQPAAGAASVDDWFAVSVLRSPLHLWRPGEPVEQRGVRLLLGVATWSGYDMRLLDVVEEALVRDSSTAPTVDVFNTQDCQRPGAFRRYIPGLRKVFQMPVAGIWREGALDWSGQGYEAREQVARMFGSSSAEIVTYVQSWLERRSAAPGSNPAALPHDA